jgi:hypothetical protein
MARRLKISSISPTDYTIIGVSCHLREYRFAYFINERLGFHFRRIEDFRPGAGPDTLFYSFYQYPHPDERRNYFLLANFHELGRLVPEERGADYFMITDDLLPVPQSKKLLSRIQSIPQVLAAYPIPQGKAKNLEVIFEEIELQYL